MSSFRRTDGFTLVEFAIVMVLSGIMMVAGMQAYSIYLKSQRIPLTYERMSTIKSAMTGFANITKRYPCPANPALDLQDPNAGVEDCTLMNPLLPVGTCNGQACKENGQRDTEVDGDVDPDPVLTGAIPFKTIRETLNSTSANMGAETTLDAWGRRMSYTVSGYMTQSANFSSSHGTIAVHKEDGVSLIQPINSAHYVIVSHGSNGVGAYNREGRNLAPCGGAANEVNNCNLGSVFIDGLQNAAAGANYFDDLIMYETYVLSSLWDYSSIPGFETSLHNLNSGSVGVGTSTPLRQLDVGGTIGGATIKSQQICDASELDCFPADILGGAVGITCPSLVPNTIRLVTGIAGNNVDCSANIPLPSPIGQNCLGTQFMVGINSLGTIICE